MAEYPDNTKAYATSDLYFAAFLRVACVPFLRTEREGSRVVFIFEYLDTLQDLKTQYFNRQAKVSALSYVDEIRNMKSLTHL